MLLAALIGRGLAESGACPRRSLPYYSFMPELAEVEYFRKQWDCGRGEKILRTALHKQKRIFRGQKVNELQQRLRGSTLASSEARGKQLLFYFTPDVWLGIHLGMTGKLRAEPAGFKPLKHDHLILYQKNRALILNDMRLFGRVLFHHGSAPPEWWSTLPASLTGPAFTETALRQIVRKRARMPIKSLLLLQKYFPGIGNWMADEILWQARIAPVVPAGKLAANKRAVAKLWRSVQEVSRRALEKVGKDFSDPPEGWLFHERWKKEGHCPRDGNPLRKKVIGGRTSAFCPRCQRSQPL